YHSWAVLLQDGRVLSGGGGLCGDCGVNHRTAQIYTPAYLYNPDGSLAQRPELGTLGATLYADEPLYVSVAGQQSDPQFALVRLSSVTHAINTDQRWIPVESNPLAAGAYQLQLPSNPNVLIPGYYWLFAYSATGAPSKGHLIQIEPGQRTSDSPPVVPSAINVEFTVGQPIDYTLTAFEPDGQSLLFTVDTLPAGLSLDITAGRVVGTPQTIGESATQITVSDGTNAVQGVVNWRIAEVQRPVFTAGSLNVFWIALLALIGYRRRARAWPTPWPASC
ncbi:MAG: galactose oxidase-like domain-containing protein, partial [Pseudomonadota bacterium]